MTEKIWEERKKESVFELSNAKKLIYEDNICVLR